MTKFLEGHWYNILKYLTVVGVIVFISFLFPSSDELAFKYREGQSWAYESLIADYNFPVLKRTDQVEAEKQAIIDNFIPYYDYDSRLKDSLINRFSINLNSLIIQLRGRDEATTLVQNPSEYKQLGTKILSEIFTGFVVSDEEVENKSTQSELIRVVDKSETRTISRSELVSIHEVKSKVTNMLARSDLKETDYLLQVITDIIKPNTFYNKERTDKILQSKLDEVSTIHGVVEKGETIVSKGQIVTPQIYQELLSYEKEYSNRNIGDRKDLIVFLGLLLLTTLIIGAFILFLQFNAKPAYEKFSNLLFMLMWLVIYSYLVSVIDGIDDLSVYMIPFCIVPIVVMNFFSDRIALYLHIVIILIASLLSREGHEFTFLQIFVGIVTILTFKPSRYWLKFFTSISLIFLAYILGNLGLSLIRVGSLTEIDWQPFVWVFIASFLTLLAFPLVPMLERIFGFTSSITLAELSDINRPLLKELTTKAPGTFQHSLQVSNLAETAAEKIGADALLVKVGALFHDIGKTKNPKFFIENQGPYDSPHDELSAKESAEIIMRHVEDGVAMAKKGRIPSVIIDFIRTHHGTTRVEYFYHQFKEDNPDIQVDPGGFSYPGPKPQTKEQAILMMADSIEASAKSLKLPTERDIDKLVDTIIDGKIKNKQFSECDLSFKDLDECRAVFKKVMKSVNHVRIEYPEQEP